MSNPRDLGELLDDASVSSPDYPAGSEEWKYDDWLRWEASKPCDIPKHNPPIQERK